MRTSFGRHSCGLALILMVACIWVAASQLIESIFKDLSFDKPYFLTYFNTCGFSFWLLGALCKKSWRQQLLSPRSASPAARSSDDSSSAGSSDNGSESGLCSSASAPMRGHELQRPRHGLGARKYARIALSICPAWMLANYFFNLSLDYTSVSSNSMLSTTSNVWTLLFSFCFLGQSFSPVHVLAVFVTMAGAILVSSVDAGTGDSGAENTWGGDVLALVSACLYGTYSVLLKYCLPDSEEDASMPLVFGFVGLLVFLGGWPFLLLLNASGFETLELPSGNALASLTLNALIGTNLSDVLWACALQLTSPLVATLGLSLTIPLGMLSDFLIRSKSFSTLYVVGALLVLAGFVLGSLADYIGEKLCPTWKIRGWRADAARDADSV
eukprot:TRINITY_DN55856_c0_g1_i1.p1 TRINITY_DN55856_c0_g1~~TRINITY_DN55856_c0_g1_i1.p1  ORF type:complete len:398 (+),score=49.29 TRINITY_DN55856_c0_g1_i1:43-1194(+)